MNIHFHIFNECIQFGIGIEWTLQPGQPNQFTIGRVKRRKNNKFLQTCLPEALVAAKAALEA